MTRNAEGESLDVVYQCSVAQSPQDTLVDAPNQVGARERIGHSRGEEAIEPGL
jgi:hypothetical protein